MLFPQELQMSLNIHIHLLNTYLGHPHHRGSHVLVICELTGDTCWGSSSDRVITWLSEISYSKPAAQPEFRVLVNATSFKPKKENTEEGFLSILSHTSGRHH